jgi:hypothetical protein
MASDRRDAKQKGGEGFLLGAERFAKISAVEGIELTSEMRQRAQEAERLGLSPEQRLERIKSAYRKG